MPQLFGVTLPQLNKFELKQKIRTIPSHRKNVLYFFYSEFLLRANRNPWYKAVLNRATIAAIDGKGLHWAMWRIMKPGFLPSFYTTFCLNTPIILRIPLFLIFFTLEGLTTLFNGFVTLTLKYNFTARTKNQVILGRDFVYDLLNIAQENGWKTMVLGGSQTADEVTKNLIVRLFPELDLLLWTRQSTSLLMRDQKPPEFTHQTLTTNNVCQHFPDLWDAKQYIKQEKPDLILMCLGGASGKQEFFIDNLLLDKEVTFTLATGLGAAVDHLGGGVKQTVAPNWMIKSGLEWFYRFMHQPYRRLRIIDSIVTLWWWTTVEEFMVGAKERLTVVNIIHNKLKNFLLVKRRNLLPGDIDWTFVQGGIEKKETPETAGLREIIEEVKLPLNDLLITNPSVFSEVEQYSVSLGRFIGLGAKYKSAKKYLNFVEFEGDSTPETNWENEKAAWVEPDEILDFLSVEKIPDWQNAAKIVYSNQ